MKTSRVVLSIFKTCIALAIAMVVIMMLLRFSTKAYEFGYRIFYEEPMSQPPGYTMSVAIVEGKSVMEIGEILEDKGLIRDKLLFYLQEFVSDYHGLIQPGVYELSTAMTPDEMLAIMSQEGTGEEEEFESSANSELQDASADVFGEEGGFGETDYLQEDYSNEGVEE